MPAERKQYNDLGLTFDTDFLLTLNYDGVTVFKSGTSGSLWPILATIDGLPVHEKKAKVLLLGAYFGIKRDDPGTGCGSDSRPQEVHQESFTDYMFHRLLKSLEEIRNNGILWMDPISKAIQRNRGFLSKVICDSMARPFLMGLSNLHGKFGCPCSLSDNSKKRKISIRAVARTALKRVP